MRMQTVLFRLLIRTVYSIHVVNIQKKDSFSLLIIFKLTLQVLKRQTILLSLQQRKINTFTKFHKNIFATNYFNESKFNTGC